MYFYLSKEYFTDTIGHDADTGVANWLLALLQIFVPAAVHCSEKVARYSEKAVCYSKKKERVKSRNVSNWSC